MGSARGTRAWAPAQASRMGLGTTSEDTDREPASSSGRGRRPGTVRRLGASGGRSSRWGDGPSRRTTERMLTCSRDETLLVPAPLPSRVALSTVDTRLSKISAAAAVAPPHGPSSRRCAIRSREKTGGADIVARSRGPSSACVDVLAALQRPGRSWSASTGPWKAASCPRVSASGQRSRLETLPSSRGDTSGTTRRPEGWM